MTLAPEDVFTPRSSSVNTEMYVRRSSIEVAFGRAFAGNRHLIVHGESGSGKSWLYKNYFRENEIFYVAANLANAARFNSVQAEFKNCLDRLEREEMIEYSREYSIGWFFRKVFSFLFRKAARYRITAKEPYESILQYVHEAAGGKRGALILDNLEAILGTPALVSEVGNIITLLDDDRYAAYNVKLVLVGIPSNIREYFSKQSSKTALTNRLEEVPELPRFILEEAHTFIEKGFSSLLRMVIWDKRVFADHVFFVTDGIPDQMQAYSLLVAQSVEDGRIDKRTVELADKSWLKQHLSDSYQAIVSLMNSRETSVGRRNQVLYALGRITASEFTYNDVESVVRGEFPENTQDVTLAIGQILGELAGGENAILKRSQKKDAYLFKNPVYRMGIRASLRKSNDEKVERIYIEDL